MQTGRLEVDSCRVEVLQRMGETTRTLEVDEPCRLDDAHESLTCDSTGCQVPQSSSMAAECRHISWDGSMGGAPGAY